MRYEILMQKQAQIGLPRRRILSHIKIKIVRVNSFEPGVSWQKHYVLLTTLVAL